MQDANLIFSAAQAVFGNGTTVQSTNWLPLKAVQDLGGADGPDVEVIVKTSFAGGTSARFQLTLVDAAGANPVVIGQSVEIPVAQLLAPTGTIPMGGTIIRFSPNPLRGPLPASTLSFVRVQTVNTGNNTAGSISAHLLPKAATTAPGKDYPSSI